MSSSFIKIGIPLIIGSAIVIAIAYMTNPALLHPGQQPVTATATSTIPTSLSEGNSNADLEQDMARINAQIEAGDNDAATVDQGLNDQPVQQDQ